MKFPHFFIDRPIFAAVLSILILVFGLVALPTLPVQQYPEIAPPTVVIAAQYPGASAETLAETVAAPIEEAVNGVENMIYMSSSNTGDGQVQITITFAQGTDADQAQVLVQNRVASAEPRLPEQVRQIGVTVLKQSPDFLLIAQFFSPDGSLSQEYVSNYIGTQVLDQISRVNGVGNAQAFGSRDYSMRIWIDPDLAAARNMTVDEITNAVRAQNVQAAVGTIGQPPFNTGQTAFQLGLQAEGRLTTPEQFGAIVLKRSEGGALTRLRDVARIELGAENYAINVFLNGKASTAIAVSQLPGSNALDTADAVIAEFDRMAESFPPGMSYAIAYNPTEYISASIDAVFATLIEAVILVSIVVLVFLQSWRAAIIPILAIPISLVGSLAVLLAFGYSLNSLSLFGMVLAIGIVVDDAIVVVENVERLMEEKGLSPLQAAHETMDEVSGALIAIALVLCGVFIPTSFIPGISGTFYQQFALTIASATAISAFVSLTLSPAMAALVLKPKAHDAEPRAGWRGLPGRFARGFNRGFDWLADRYGRLTARTIRKLGIVAVVYLLLIAMTGWRFYATPTGFIPPQDQGFVIAAAQLPPGASLERTTELVRQANALAKQNPAVKDTIMLAGLDGTSFSAAPNAATMFITLKPQGERAHSDVIANELRGAFGQLSQGMVLVIPPPPVPGIGTGGGWKMMIEDRQNRGYAALEGAAMQMMMKANQAEGIVGAFSLFNTRTPRLYADIDRERAEQLGVPVGSVFATLGTYLGSAYINDFNFLGRTFRVTAQADAPYRDQASDVGRLRARSASGQMVPLNAVMTLRDDSGPYRVVRYNLYPSAELQGDTVPGFSTGQSLATMERIANETLPDGMAFEWTDLAFQQKQAGNTGVIAFGLAVLFVFLLLAANYESLTLPFAVILIVPMCLLAAMLGVNLMGMDNNILTQIGLVVLIGLAAKNAILIVEFAKHNEDGGEDMYKAAQHAAAQRLRPILMTSIAFILGVLPLVIGSGPGSELRAALGVAVFFGMIGVTLFGLLFTPAFYVISRRLGDWAGSLRRRRTTHAATPQGEAA
ncbi:efflux RND transporter permease subunit [Sphingomonas baiyangensis]|uniref:Efflux pump membrane transporter n=1 Tax=Sphingomonas baiyangensis TaxID=2572576 RepID=A0A4U1L3J6_9SPHN|nr:multidrug efflux RND transporter permease subunit [Sphingomonas baiyangensis]TKD51054.1 multidrug efflux RND transporter permease subunit [Sphingomonas baiyangensis]